MLELRQDRKPLKVSMPAGRHRCRAAIALVRETFLNTCRSCFLRRGKNSLNGAKEKYFEHDPRARRAHCWMVKLYAAQAVLLQSIFGMRGKCVLTRLGIIAMSFCAQTTQGIQALMAWPISGSWQRRSKMACCRRRWQFVKIFAQCLCRMICSEGDALTTSVKAAGIVDESSDINLTVLRKCFKTHAVVMQGHLPNSSWPRQKRKYRESVDSILCTCLEFLMHANCEHVVFAKALQGKINLNAIPQNRKCDKSTKSSADASKQRGEIAAQGEIQKACLYLSPRVISRNLGEHK